MKLFFGFAIFIWLLCGFIGDWRLEGIHSMHWKNIARGPNIRSTGRSRAAEASWARLGGLQCAAPAAAQR